MRERESMATYMQAEGVRAGGKLIASESTAGRLLLVVSATAVMALAAHIAVPLPFTPVPMVMTPLAVLVIGMMLGPAAACGTMVLYLLEGAVGLPVFAPGGLGGVAQLLGPTGGFLLAYPLVAAVAGWLVRRSWLRSAMVRGLLAGSVATTVLLLCGAAWLTVLLHLTVGSAWRLAVAPFVPGESLKIVAAAMLYSMSRRWSKAA